MKKIFFSFLVLMLLLAACSQVKSPAASEGSVNENTVNQQQNQPNSMPDTKDKVETQTPPAEQGLVYGPTPPPEK